MNKADVGRIGGQHTSNKYGSSYMRDIGRKGAAAFWKKYKLQPIGTSGWAIVDRETNQIKATNNWKGLTR